MVNIYDQKPWIKFYDKHIPASLQFPDKPFWEFIEPSISRFPKRVGLQYMGTSFTFKQLDEMANRFANLLKKIGLQKGDTVGVNLLMDGSINSQNGLSGNRRLAGICLS